MKPARLRAPPDSAQEEGSRVSPLQGRSFVIDGTNIVLLHGRTQPELRYLLALIAHIEEQGAESTCFLDANTRYLLKDHRPDQLNAFDRIIDNHPWSERLHIVASGTEADESILARAKRDQSEVISNDKFRNRAKKNRWIWKRRHSVQVRDGYLLIPSLAVVAPVLAKAEEYLAEV